MRPPRLSIDLGSSASVLASPIATLSRHQVLRSAASARPYRPPRPTGNVLHPIRHSPREVVMSIALLFILVASQQPRRHQAGLAPPPPTPPIPPPPPAARLRAQPPVLPRRAGARRRLGPAA